MKAWLPAWTGNRPDLLLSFYADNAFYRDPAIPAGIRGREALHAYFSKLLGRNPEWVWVHRGSIPMRDGFLNQWRATIPVRDRRIEASLRQRLLKSRFGSLERVFVVLVVACHRQLGRRGIHAGYGQNRDDDEQNEADNECRASLPACVFEIFHFPLNN